MAVTYGRIVLDGIDPVFRGGLPISGATLTVYLTGTFTLANIYGTNTGASALLNPQTSDINGNFYGQSSTIWADASQGYDLAVAYPGGGATTYSGVYTLAAPPDLSAYLKNPSVALTGIPTAPTPAANDNSSKIATTAFVQAAITAAINAISIFPSGMVVDFGTSVVPTGWLLCNGAAVSRTTYAALFAAIGTTFGAGDGSTTFNVPDCRGLFRRGQGTNGTLSTAVSGALGAIVADQGQGHVHYGGVVSTTGSSPAYAYATTTNDIPGLSGNTMHTDANVAQQQALTSVPKTDGTNGTPRTGLETRPAAMAFNVGIKT